jgi:hypothetical protein
MNYMDLQGSRQDSPSLDGAARSAAGRFELGLSRGFALLDADQLLHERQTAAAGRARLTSERNLVGAARPLSNALPNGSIANAVAVTDEHRGASRTVACCN